MTRRFLAALAVALVLCTAAYAADAKAASPTDAAAPASTPVAAPVPVPEATPVAVPEAVPHPTPEATTPVAPPATAPAAVTPVTPPEAVATVATPVPVSEVKTTPVATPVPVPEATAPVAAAPATPEPVQAPAAAATPATPAAPQPAETMTATPLAAEPAEGSPVAAVPAPAPVESTPVVTEPAAATPVAADPVPAPAAVEATPVVTEPAAATPVAANPVPAPAPAEATPDVTGPAAATPVAANPVPAPAEATPAAPATPDATVQPPTTTSNSTSTTPNGGTTVTATTSGSSDSSQTGQDPAAPLAPAAEAPAAPAAPKDPCLAVPGCTACIASSTSSTAKPFAGSRKLLQGGMGDMGMAMGMGGGSSNLISGVKTGKHRSYNFDALLISPYDQPNLPMCTACTAPGYTQGSSGKCNCKAGFGDSQPTGYCNQCPDGSVSLGGHRATCVECENVAWSTDDRTMCICASGWYGYTNSLTRQASCNQCPGTRPVSKDGSRSAADCRACPAGTAANEIFDDCVTTVAAPPAPPMTLADLLDQSAPPSPPPEPPAPRVFNESTFKDAAKDWKIQTRATRNITNPLTDFLGSIAEKMIMGEPINAAANITQPGDLLYSVLTKPAVHPTAPNLEGLASLGGIGAALGTAAGALPNLATAVQTGDFVKVVETLGAALKSVEAATQGKGAAADAAGGNQLAQLLSGLTGSGSGSSGSGSSGSGKALGQILSGLAGGNAGSSSSGSGSGNNLGQAVQLLAGLTGNGNNAGLAQVGTLLSGLAANQGKSGSSDSSGNGLGNMLQGLVKVVKRAPSPVAAMAASPASSGMGALLTNAAKTTGGFVKVPSAPAKGGSNLRLAGSSKSGTKKD